MMRTLHWFYRRALRLWQWLRRRLTPAGGFVLAGLALATSLSSNPEQTVAYQAFVLLLVLMVVAAATALGFRLPVSVRRQLPRFGTIGEPLRYRVTVRNLHERAQTGLEYLENVAGEGLSLAEFTARLRPGRRSRSFRLGDSPAPARPAVARPHPLPTLPPRGQGEMSVELLPQRRGILQFSGVWVGRADPLGLFRALRHLALPGAVTVLPRRYPVAAISLPGHTEYQPGGVTFASGVGESEEFVALREYRRGDPLRRVHWRVSARMGRPVVREYQDEFFVRHALVLDTFGEPVVDALFEEAVSVAASFACTVPSQDSLLDLLFVGPQTVCVTTGRGVGHVEQMLEVLACARPCREPRFVELEALVLRHSGRVSGCILVLLDWDEPRRRLVRQLKGLRLPVWVFLLVPRGESRPPEPASALERPDRWIVLEAGRVAETLRAL